MADRTQRPAVPLTHANESEHRRQLALRANSALPMDGSQGMTAPLPLWMVATADLPAAAAHEGRVVYDTTANTLKVSDGTSWVDYDTADHESRVAALENQTADHESRVAALENQVGRVVQQLSFTSTTTDTTTAATMQDSSLVGSITPMFANSVIEVEAIFPQVVAERVAGSSSGRTMATEIRNETDNVSSPEYRWGRRLVAESSASAAVETAAIMKWRYTVNSTAARTFRVRYRSLVATNIKAELRAADATATLVLQEIRQ